MSEYKLCHLVTELARQFGEKNADQYLDYLQNNINVNKDASDSSLGMQSLIQQMAQSGKNSESFLCKFEELKQKNVDALPSFIHLLHSISKDTNIKDFLLKTAKKTGSSTSVTAGKLTKDSIPQLKHKLKEALIKPTKIDSETCTFTNKSNIMSFSPSITSWVMRRPSMSWDFSSHTALTIAGPIGTIPQISQENILIEDLLNIFMGLPSCYIEPLELKDPYDSREFFINDTVDPSLKELVKKILPLASHYSVAQRFIEEKQRFEFGQVNNALAECFHSIIIDYTLFVTQLETEFHSGNLNLHKMWFFVQKNLHSLGILASIATTINKSDAKGGKVLSLLHENITSYIGDAKAQNLCVLLMEAACIPYMRMLGMWIHKGIIIDPIHEFLIEDNEVVQKEDMPIDYSADYWDKKYTVHRERIPKFLESISDIILRAGKYLNVIRQCGKSLHNKIEKIEYKLEEKHYIDAIQKAYIFASQTLLTVVIDEQDLLGRLKSVKHYFLLDKGDFIVTFLTLCEKEFTKNVNDVIPARLESLLDLAIRLSSAVNDPYKDDLKSKLLPYDLQSQMFKILCNTSENDFWVPHEKEVLTVIETFSFGYEVRWPLSLILNKHSLACYQMIFRYLFYCKYVERMISQVWKSNKVAKKFPLAISQQYRKPFVLRQRMLHCVQNLEYHMMVEVIEPNWCAFLQKIGKVNNVDEVLICHNDFLNACLKDCMLTIPHLLGTITKLLMICVDFCKFMQADNMQQSINQHQDSPEHIESFEESISRFDKEFTTTLMQLLNQINALNSSDHGRIFNLLYRLDFNSSYTRQFEKLGANELKNEASG